MFTPIIAVRNIGKDASSVTGNIPYTINGKTDRIRLSELSLSPGEIGLLAAPIQWRQISAASAGLEIEYSGAPGSVIASVISVSQSGDKVFPLMMKDPEAVASSSGGYPWFAEDDYSSVVYIKNVTDKPQTFVLDVKYRQGMWGSGLNTVPPGETYVFDVKQARDSQIKGSEGNTIPLDAENGHIYWTIYGTIEKGLIGRSEAVYAYGGMAQTYECQPCPCPASTNSCMLEPPSLIGFPGDTAQLSFLQRTYNCHGAYGSWFPVSVNNFASDNPGVASISSGGFSTALSPGTAQFSASTLAQVNYWNGFGCATQYVNAVASAVCDVSAFTPDHVYVLDDTKGPVSQECPSTIQRVITYQVVDVNNNKLNYPQDPLNVNVKEAFSNMTQNTCGTGNPTPSGCGPTTGVDGRWKDTLTMTTCQGAANCGLSFTQELQWCPSTGSPVTLAKFQVELLRNKITVAGNSTDSETTLKGKYIRANGQVSDQ